MVTAELLKFSAIYKQGKGHYAYLKLILHNWILYFHFIDPSSVWPEAAPFKTQTYTSDFFQVESTPGDFIVHIPVLLQCSLCFQGFHTIEDHLLVDPTFSSDEFPSIFPHSKLLCSAPWVSLSTLTFTCLKKHSLFWLSFVCSFLSKTCLCYTRVAILTMTGARSLTHNCVSAHQDICLGWHLRSFAAGFVGWEI